MSNDKFSATCHNCGGKLQMEQLSCCRCNIKIQGVMPLPRLAQLNAEEREFVELFILSAGSLKEVGKVLNLSYPTVRGRLDSVISSLQELDKQHEKERLAIIQRLENRELEVNEAVQLLASLT